MSITPRTSQETPAGSIHIEDLPIVEVTDDYMAFTTFANITTFLCAFHFLN